MIEHTDRRRATRYQVRRAPRPASSSRFAGSDIARGETLLRPRHGDRLARDRHARRLRPRARAGRSPAARRRALDRRRARAAGRCRCGRPRSTTPTARSSPRRSPRTAASAGLLGAVPRRRGGARGRPAQAPCGMRHASSCPAAPRRARAISPIASSRASGRPGIVAHGVALKPGKPLCLAVCDGKPVVVLPGFPTSAMFTFHDIVAPVLRRMAGLPARTEAQVDGAGARARSLRARPHRVRDGLARRGRGRARRLSDRPRARARSPPSRRRTASCASRRSPTTRRPAPQVPVTLLRAAPAAARSRRHRQPLHRPRRRRSRPARGPGFSARLLAVGSLGGLAAAAARRVRPRADPPARSAIRHLQRAVPRRRARARAGLAADAGRRLPAGRPALRGQDARGGGARPRSPIPTA